MTFTDAWVDPRLDSAAVRESPEVQEAIDAWGQGQVSLFDFACLANSIVGKRDGGTERLAKKIRRSVDTVERYAAAGALWLAMLKHFPAESEIFRENLDVSFWMAVGAVYKSDLVDEEGAKHWLDEAHKNDWTVEKLRSMLPTKKAGESPFTRAMKSLYRTIEKDILQAPALNSNMNDKEYKVFINVAKWMHKFLKGKLEMTT